VSELAARVAHRLGRSAAEIQRCRLAGLVHDVGKLRVPVAVLTRAGALGPAEWDLMRAHAAHGEALVLAVPELRPLARIVRHHHERADGRGYPDGLAGEAIPLEARIVAAVDAWSAMTSDRPYRRALGFDAAVAELDRVAGAQLDAEVVAALKSVVGADLQAAA
jgi:HD-GYP domain-containing protein (c-di-GMP phosphodiesterase class II)